MSQAQIMESTELAFASPKEHYTADACIVWCFDNRFWGLLNKFLERWRDAHFDLVMLAGGARSLYIGRRLNDRTILNQIAASIRFHRINRVILITHSDCGAFGGLSAFGNDPEREFAEHSKMLIEAAAYVKDQLGKSMEVETWFADFDGLHRVN